MKNKNNESSTSIYDVNKDFNYNITYGPFWSEPLPSFGVQKFRSNLFGHKLWSPFGVSASPMTFGAKHIHLMSQLGYDVLTYRSVRSIEWQGWVEAPHLGYADIEKPWKDLNESVKADIKPFAKQDVSAVNSFGIQSLAPSQWQRDFEAAQSLIGKGQILILALMTTPRENVDQVEDFVAVAKEAMKTSAEILEINLACPNSGEASLIYEDITLSTEIARQVKKVVKDKKLLLKVGYYSDQDDVLELVKQTHRFVNGYTSINTIGVNVANKQGKVFFPGRDSGGLSGAAVRELAMKQARSLVEAKKKFSEDLVIIGVGGVTKPQHIQEYLDIGVNVVQAVTGVWADPLLAVKYKQFLANK